MRNAKIALFAIISIICLFAVGIVWHFIYGELPFDSKLWNQADGNVRLRMVSDLRLKLSGLNRARVRQLLGEPVTDLGLYPGDYYYYGLGTQTRFLDTDGIWLCIKFRNGQTDAILVAHD